jgi:hypothetical protein
MILVSVKGVIDHKKKIQTIARRFLRGCWRCVYDD